MIDEPTLSKQQRITDSPWFWVMLFCGSGIVFLAAFAPKYAARQARLELQYHARQEIARRQVEAQPAAREQGMEGSEAPPAAGELIIPLWPLLTLFALAFVGSGFFLWRSISSPADGNSHQEVKP